jgi:pimeloyl-ACP methyl ester carboxylesterase
MSGIPTNIKIYCIPGLGLNASIFEPLQLHFDGLQIIDWLESLRKESLSDYAKRMSANIETNENVILIGHSFGGILAQEITKHANVGLVFLISSVKSADEIPFSLKLVSKLGIYRLVTKWSILFSFPFWGAKHGYDNASLKTIFKNSIKSLSTYYQQWSLMQIGAWKGDQSSTDVIQIHGTKDLTFPLKLIKNPSFLIENGDHLMVYKKAEEISEIIKAELLKHTNTSQANLR